MQHASIPDEDDNRSGADTVEIPVVARTRNTEVLLFEHTDMGTGGLVLNCPTPIRLRDIPVERFAFFGDLPLMMGCGFEMEEEEESFRLLDSHIPLADFTPWFWIHNLPDISGSFALEAASGPLFMGGNLDEAMEYLRANNIVNPAGRFQFFREYISWGPGQLEDEMQGGKWEQVGPLAPERALQQF